MASLLNHFIAVGRGIRGTTAPSRVSPVKFLFARAMFATSTCQAQQPKVTCSVEWLSRNLDKVKLLDGSWHLPTIDRDARQEFAREHIKGARFFDIDRVKDVTNPLPHMLPPADVFEEEMGKFGISNGDHVVIYDSAGFGPACRVGWTFHAMGHQSVSILDGGILSWKHRGLPIVSGEEGEANTCGDSGSNYKARPLSSLIWSYDDILTNIKKLQESDGKDGHQIVDARPSGRFSGVDPEIRPGMSSGHMPFALNVPSSQVTKLSGEGGTPHLRSKDELIELFTGAGIDLGRPIVTTCGSGVTAAVLYMALLEAGAKRVAVYDGSWTEYAQKPESPIVKDA